MISNQLARKGVIVRPGLREGRSHLSAPEEPITPARGVVQNMGMINPRDTFPIAADEGNAVNRPASSDLVGAHQRHKIDALTQLLVNNLQSESSSTEGSRCVEGFAGNIFRSKCTRSS